MSEDKNGMSVKVVVKPSKTDGPINLDRPRKVAPKLTLKEMMEEITGYEYWESK